MTKEVEVTKGVQGTPNIRVLRGEGDPDSFNLPNTPKRNYCYDPLFIDEKTAVSA